MALVLYGGLAILMVLVFQLALPAVVSRLHNAPSGLNYGQMFLPGFREIGWFLAAGCVLLIPIHIAKVAADRGMERLIERIRRS
jgi:hypothetical protein